MRCFKEHAHAVDRMSMTSTRKKQTAYYILGRGGDIIQYKWVGGAANGMPRVIDRYKCS